MYEDYGVIAGWGIGMMIFGVVLYLGILALGIWISYLIIRTAVKNGILKADDERARRGYGPQVPPQGYRPSQPPGYGHPPQG